MNTKRAFFELLLCATALLMPFTILAQWGKINAPNYPGLNEVVRLDDTLFATAVGEVFRSDDAGATWEKIFEGYALIVNPFDNGLYVFSNSGPDVYGSTDFGHTWQYGFTSPVGGILVPGFNPDTVFVHETKNLLRKTANGWDTVFQINGPGAYFNKVARTGQHLWVAATTGAFHSPDLGETWEQLNAANSSLAVVGDTVLLSYCISDSYLFRTADFGATWQTDTFSNPRFCSIDATEDAFFSINPSDGNYNIYTSKNGLTDWNEIYIDSLHWMPRGFRIVNNQMVLACPSGLPKWVNGHWIFHQFPRSAVSPTYGNRLLGYLDNYLLSQTNWHGHSTDNGTTWTSSAVTNGMPRYVQKAGNLYAGIRPVLEPVLFKCAADGHFEWETLPLPFMPRSLAAIGDTLYLLETGSSPVYRSVDGGLNWASSGQSFFKDIFSLNGRLYQLGGNGLMSTADGGANWTSVWDSGNPVDGTFNLLIEDGHIYIYNTVFKWVMHSADKGASFDTLDLPPVTNSLGFGFRAIGKWNFITNFSDTLYVKNVQSDNWLYLPMPFPPGTVSDGWNNMTANDSFFFLPTNLGEIWRLNVSQLGEVSGCVFLDTNGNNNRDTGEKGIANVLVKSLFTGFYGVTDTLGKFSFANNIESDVIQPVTAFPHYFYTPAEAPVQLSDTLPVCFALQTTETINDLSVHLVAQTAFRTGFDNSIFATVFNEGTTTQSGTLKLVPDPFLELLATIPPANTATGDTLVWQFSNFPPLSSLTFRMDVKTGTALPGTPVVITAQVSGAADADSLDNADVLSDFVVASYDPNDKLVRPATIPDDGVANAEIRYTIRFQNTGNIPTNFVTLRDTLSPFIEPESVRILGASHPFSWNLEKGNILVFSFNPLYLPPAAVDEPGSHGFVQFAVRLKDGAGLGDSIANTAHIYFDFNPAIVTNTALTVISETSGTSTSVIENSLSITPNPATGRVYIRAVGEVDVRGTICLYASNGQLVLSRTTDAAATEISLPDLPVGQYVVIWHLGGRIFSGALTVVKN
ncbi:MAG: hypothetical protein EPGJADBJ_02022 [Saprospiraceae bacterium]|nr:hypothetical protein [Saprospiraceae bacterium]